MRTRGYCTGCSTITTVNVTRPGTDSDVPRGLCDACQAIDDLPAYELTIFVPKSNEGHDILPASGIVGLGGERGSVLVYYEGNLLAIEDYEVFEERLRRATERLIHGAPTVARAVLPRHQLVPVGAYDARRYRIIRIEDHEALEVWLSRAPSRWCQTCGEAVIPCYRATCPAGWHHVGHSHHNDVAGGDLDHAVDPVPKTQR